MTGSGITACPLDPSLDTLIPRGPAKVMCHLMFGILALTANQMMCFLE